MFVYLALARITSVVRPVVGVQGVGTQHVAMATCLAAAQSAQVRAQLRGVAAAYACAVEKLAEAKIFPALPCAGK